MGKAHNTMSLGFQYAVIFTLALLGCASETGESEEIKTGVTDEWFNRVVSSINPPPDVSIVRRSAEPLVGHRLNEDGVRVPNITVAVDAQKNVHEFLVLQPNSGQVWPGNVVQYSGVKSGILNPVGLPFSDREITVDVPRLSVKDTVFTIKIQNATYGSMEDAVGPILRSLPEVLPAQFMFTSSRIYDVESAKFSMGMGIDWPSGQIDAFLGENAISTKTNLLYELNQVYYTISVERPRSPASFIDLSNVDSSDVYKYLNEGNPPCYVSSVTYGRRIYLNIVSAEREESVKKAMDAAFEAPSIDGSFDLNDEQRRVYNTSSVTALVIGGASGSASQMVSNPTPEALRALIVEGANFSQESPGRPLSYSLRYLKNARMASVAIGAQWNEYSETPPVYLNPFRMTIVEQGFVFRNTADDDEDLSWSISIQAMGQDGQNIGSPFIRTIRDEYILQWPRDGCDKNCFYKGESYYVNGAVFAIKYNINVSSEDGDGKDWGRDTGVIDVTIPGVHRISGGHDGRWTLDMRFTDQ